MTLHMMTLLTGERLAPSIGIAVYASALNDPRVTGDALMRITESE